MSLALESKRIKSSLRQHVVLQTAIIVILLGGITLWSFATSLNGAVVSTGTVVAEGHKKVVQHRDGGVVRRLMVSDGARVARGDLLIELDGAQLRSELKAIEKRLFELKARQLRLRTERGKGNTTQDDPLNRLRDTLSDPELLSVVNTPTRTLSLPH